jgi:hypothetical protein
MDTKSIDQRVREKAHDELRKKIAAAFLPAERVYEWPHHIEIKSLNMTVAEILKLARDAIFERAKDKAAEAAVDDFLNRVNGLQAELDDLRESIPA